MGSSLFGEVMTQFFVHQTAVDLCSALRHRCLSCGFRVRDRPARTTGREIPKLYSIHKGTIVRVQDYGAFVRLGDGSKYKECWGLGVLAGGSQIWLQIWLVGGCLQSSFTGVIHHFFIPLVVPCVIPCYKLESRMTCRMVCCTSLACLHLAEWTQ